MPSPPSWSGRCPRRWRPNCTASSAGRPDTELTADELRVEYASLLSWTIGLVIGILTELEVASTKSLRAAWRRPATPGVRAA